jgi:hypothetical protein
MVVYYDNKRHIICTPYTVENIHRMAELLGLKRCWFHAKPYPHYDMPKRWVADFGLGLDEALLALDVVGVRYEQVDTRRIVKIIREHLQS